MNDGPDRTPQSLPHADGEQSQPTAKPLKGTRPHPLAERALGPAADAFGKELAPLGTKAGQLTTRVGDLLLSAMGQLVYGMEQCAEWLQANVATKLKDVPQEKITAPDPRVAVPAMQALTYSMKDEAIREMFANLLAAGMNADTKAAVHPAFTEMIKEFSSEDAKVLAAIDRNQIEFIVQLRCGNSWNELRRSYSFGVDGLADGQIRKAVNNLKRLEIIESIENRWPGVKGIEEKEAQLREEYQATANSLNDLPADERPQWPGGLTDKFTVDVRKHGLFITAFGADFRRICLPEKP